MFTFALAAISLTPTPENPFLEKKCAAELIILIWGLTFTFQ
jgi:hypothetical protein